MDLDKLEMSLEDADSLADCKVVCLPKVTDSQRTLFVSTANKIPYDRVNERQVSSDVSMILATAFILFLRWLLDERGCLLQGERGLQ